jgi:hypothetical protein
MALFINKMLFFAYQRCPLISAPGTQQTRGAGGEPPRRSASAGSHLSRYSRRTLNMLPQINIARRKCDSIFEDLAPSATINSVNKIKLAKKLMKIARFKVRIPKQKTPSVHYRQEGV